ncbi:flagellar hook-length control protein FliK [Ideonella sp. B7]|uniref:flagellar hook-length control protein FliK n=1 Tax=Ideonella benzenivorans TaxID=2831643 RepID=UPI001CECBCED|nr:flagellar hook-length control protein FliK [Ideonella benzenivorans]MCA6217214.1 flagellar hook-length control protein FliK [Ideonella benzenivorans]
MTLALNPTSSSPRATPNDTAAAPAGAPADNVTPDTTQPTQDTAASDRPPTAGFQQALQQAGAQDDASPSTEADATLEALDLARWLSGQSAAATTTATATDPAPADAPQDGNDGTAQALAQDSPALRMDWTNLPVAMTASLVGQNAPRTTGRADTSAAAPAIAAAPHPALLPGSTAQPPRPSQPTPDSDAAPATSAAATNSAPAPAPAEARASLAVAVPSPTADGDSDSPASGAVSPSPNSTPLAWGHLDAASAGTGSPATDASSPVRAHTPQALRETLGERLSWQVDQRSEQATIRLSPERLGHIEIQIRHEAGGLQVQLAASHSEVARQLQQVSDGLRQDLGLRHGGEVSVQVAERRDNAGLGEGGGRQQQGRSPEEQRPGRALAEADQDAESPFTFA